MRGQGAAEYALVLTVIAVFVAAVALDGFREQELNLAVAAARHASLEYVATQNSSLTLGGLEHARSADNTTLKPLLYYRESRIENASALPGFRLAVLDSVRRTLNPDAELSEGQACVRARTTRYCCCGEG